MWICAYVHTILIHHCLYPLPCYHYYYYYYCYYYYYYYRHRAASPRPSGSPAASRSSRPLSRQQHQQPVQRGSNQRISLALLWPLVVVIIIVVVLSKEIAAAETRRRAVCSMSLRLA
jgi:hypothetical protein